MTGDLASTDIAAQLQRRRAAAADAWQLRDEIVLVGAGEPIHVPGRADITYPFVAHSEYYWLTDRNRPGGVLAFDPGEGWFDFPAPVTVADRLWSGVRRRTRSGRPRTICRHGCRPATAARRAVWLGVADGRRAPRAGGDQLTERLRLQLSAVRRPKDAVELERMRAAQQATRAAFARAPSCSPTESPSASCRSSSRPPRSDTAPPRWATTRSSARAPTPRCCTSCRPAGSCERGELVLIDAGAEQLGYVSDITRTFCVGGVMSETQQELHAVVHAAQRAAIERVAPGVEWRDVHRTAALAIADGLVAAGILRGDAESLVESGAVGLFFPHGIGHLVGLGVRDAGEPLYERRHEPPPYPNLRIDLPLEPGMVVTVEPGVYFVPALLQDPERRARHRDEVDWDRVDRMLGFGGIRIEDNLLVTADGHEVITADVPLLG